MNVIYWDGEMGRSGRYKEIDSIWVVLRLRCLVDTLVQMSVGNWVYKYEAQGSGQQLNKKLGSI